MLGEMTGGERDGKKGELNAGSPSAADQVVRVIRRPLEPVGGMSQLDEIQIWAGRKKCQAAGQETSFPRRKFGKKRMASRRNSQRAWSYQGQRNPERIDRERENPREEKRTWNQFKNGFAVGLSTASKAQSPLS